MSEKIYAWLLRLYPSDFQKAYGEEALQLFRDRARDERGFLSGLRLWLDLLCDLTVSVPREYRHVRPAMAGAFSGRRVGGVPCFDVLESGSPRPAALCIGGLLSLIVLAGVSILMSWAGGNGKMRGSLLNDPASTTVPSSPLQSTSARYAESAASAPEVRRSSEQSAVGAPAAAANEDTTLNAAERRRVIDGAAANLKQYYFDHDLAQKTADALLAHERDGEDKAAMDGAAFAALLTAQMRDTSHDMHLIMEYSQNRLPTGLPVQTAAAMERFREEMLQQHCMIRKAEILPHNIGYLKLDFFPNEAVCGTELKEAMASLNRADAIIFDLRDNSGGFPDSVSLIASYLFDHPVYMYGPRRAPTGDSWTHSPVAGNRLAHKPVFVLTSGATWSGAEQFSYNLKMLKRATLVGQVTRGGAHAGVFHRIDDHFGMGIPEERSINPYGKTDWEGVGVAPDVKVKASDALNTAVMLAEATLRQK